MKRTASDPTSSESIDEPDAPRASSSKSPALIASPVLMSALNYAVAFAPVLIVMYVFSILRSELSRVQARLDALSVRVKSSVASPATNPYDDFQRFVFASPPPQPSPELQQPPMAPPHPHPALDAAPPQARAPMEHRAVPVPTAPSPWPTPPPPAQHTPPPLVAAAQSLPVVQIIPQMQPEGAKKSLPRLEELN